MDDQKSEKFDRNNYKLQRREYDQNLQVAKTRIQLKHSKGTITAIIEYDQKTTSGAQRIKDKKLQSWSSISYTGICRKETRWVLRKNADDN